MNLYHGTYEDILEEIKEYGAIRNDTPSDTTKEFDKVLEKYLGINPRNNCIYLTADVECVYAGYDVGLKIHSSKLNANLLFVADIRLVEKIVCAHYDSTCSKEEITAMCRKFKDSIIPYDEYFTGKSVYSGRNLWELEFLYFGTINLNDCVEI